MSYFEFNKNFRTMRGIFHLFFVNIPARPTPFKLKDFFKFAFTVLGLYAGVFALFSYVPQIQGGMEAWHPAWGFLAQYVLQIILLLGPLWAFFLRGGKAKLADFGFKKIAFSRLAWMIPAYYFLYLLFSLGFYGIFSRLAEETPGYNMQESYVPFFGDDTLGLVIGFLCVSILAPLVEEIVFRGFIYRIFIKVWPVWLGSLLTAAVFAGIHFQFQTFIPLFFLGLILNTIYHHSGSLWAAIAFHSANNTIAFAAQLYLYDNPDVLEQLEKIGAFLL